jgi:hypothetical protein
MGVVLIVGVVCWAWGKACADEGLERKARIAANLAYRASVELEKAERDLYIMDGPR